MEGGKVTITCVNNGPARVSGTFLLILPSGEEQEIDGTIALCRCGVSNLMPLCDGSHKNCIPKHDDKP